MSPAAPRAVLVLATRNAHKIGELARLLEGSGIEVRDLSAFPPFPETVEDAPDLEGNAAKKAREAAAACRAWALADDTGLEVEALGGAPGVLSARWAGPGKSYADNNAKLLRELAGVPAPRRAARFRTVMALCSPSGAVETAEGRLDGTIADAPRGSNGFGYDPLFLLPDGRTLAELSAEEKNAASHRGRALRAILPRLRALAAAAACLLALAAPPAARAGKTDPPPETIWDQIMAAQAMRGLRVGHKHLEEKRYDLALQEIKRAVASDPKNATGHMLLGVAQYWNGLVDESIASYHTSLALKPDTGQAYLLLGISHAWKGDSAAAEAAFRRAAELEPQRADAQMNLGSVRETRGDFTEALDRFRLAVDLDKKNPLYRFQLGQLYRKLGRDADAAEQLREAVKLEPQYEDAWLELGCAQERLREIKAAIASFKRAVSIKPGDSVARLRLARLQLESDDRARARETMKEAFHLTPEEAGGGLQLSVSYAGGKRPAPSGAAPPKDEGAEPPPAPEDAADPLSVFERNLRRVPLDRGAAMRVDAVFLPRPRLVKAGPAEGGSLKKALARAHERGGSASPQAVRREFKVEPGDADARERQVRRIMDDLRKTMAEAPPDTDARLGLNLTLTRPKDAGRADSAEPPKVSYQPRDVGNDMGLWVIGTGWMALVAEVLPEPGDPPLAPDADAWTALGLAHATVGESQKADTAFRRATELDPKSAAAWLGRAVSAVMTGDENGAVAALRRALELEPKNKAAAQGLKWLLSPAAPKGAKEKT